MEVLKSAVAYPILREMARNILVLFGSTYMCEAAFSKMKYMKNRYRSRSLPPGIMLSALPVDFQLTHKIMAVIYNYTSCLMN